MALPICSSAPFIIACSSAAAIIEIDEVTLRFGDPRLEAELRTSRFAGSLFEVRSTLKQIPRPLDRSDDD
tara:strand:+ start:54 stop:263 length:210 start_codon:yes stop_codon:yes gene_type:complete